MTLKDGKPCKVCSTSSWYEWGNCKRCASIRTAKWREDNPGKRNEVTRKHYHENIELSHQRAKKFRQNHPELIKERGMKWRQENPSYLKNYYQDNKKTLYQKSREWIKQHIEKDRAYKKKWKQNNRDKEAAYKHKRRAIQAKSTGSFTASEWLELCERYGNKCLCCGKKTKLTVDHVIPIMRGGTSDISNIQPLCKSCNSRKNARTIDYR